MHATIFFLVPFEARASLDVDRGTDELATCDGGGTTLCESWGCNFDSALVPVPVEDGVVSRAIRVGSASFRCRFEDLGIAVIFVYGGMAVHGDFWDMTAPYIWW
jgi:hypothetical protein